MRTMTSDTTAGLVCYTGGCHCGAVRFEVDAPERIEAMDCNCSICTKTGYLHLAVPRERFRLLSGADALTTYTFNTGTARHLFCSRCGVKSFYVPRSHPDGYSVNVHCIESPPIAQVVTTQIDGRNWEKQFPEGRGRY
jgi:hypothetical protein